MGGEDSFTQLRASIPQRSAGPVGQQIHSIYKTRLGQFNSRGQYEAGSLHAIHEGRASGSEHVKLSVYSPPDLARPTFDDATSHEFKETKVGTFFGPSWSTHWFKVQLKVPPELQKKEHLELHWDANNEGLVWTKDGTPLQGLTGGGERVEWILPDSFRDGKFHTIYIEMACNGMFGNPPGDMIQPPDMNKYFQLHQAEIVAINLQARQLAVDFWIIGDGAREFPEDAWQSHTALQIENEIMDTFIAGKGSHESISKCREIATKYIGDVNSAKVYDGEEHPMVYGIGHCHIDTVWLWPWAETKRKIARSWLNQCDLMDRYPEHRFCCSQAQQFKWLEKLYPAAFDRVKLKVKKGSFQPIGGSWVEHDTNLPSGESLVRQFLYGQRFFESHFGERSRTFWLPDTFGYSSQLPQLCRLAGMNRFFTQKLSWNNINSFPHTTFNWVALDGSQVICHMAPAETYTAEAHFGDVKRSMTQHKSMDQDKTSLLVFGKGDGGGGPTWEHLEKLRRCRGISDTVGLLPKVKMGDSVEDFFDRLEKKAVEGTKFVTWYGELYFELHRGTYTSQANNKWNNRKSEIMMHDLEFLATMASIKDSSYKYPKKEMDDMWENILLCQFHDCLPGSCIEMVYDDSDEMYAGNFKVGHVLLQEALSNLGFARYDAGKDDLVGLNLLPWPRAEIVPLPGVAKSSNPQYVFVEGGPGTMTVDSSSTIHPRYAASITQLEDDVFLLQNAELQVTIARGTITSLYDIASDREVIKPGGKANQLVVFDDKPLYWQAWDVEVYHLDSREELRSCCASKIVENGPHRVSLVTETKISESSWIKTTVALSASLMSPHASPAFVDVSAEVEWHEKWKFLKVEFPVDIRNTEASYETQYGIIRRPTHYNTTWDMAKFEVCCHKWADLSENGYGVSVLNDSKYGFATCGDVMRLSLLRSPKAPDGHADMGRHHIRWAILPHASPLDHRTVRTARNFNHPLKIYSLPSSCSSAETAATSSKSSNLLSSIQLTGSPALILDCIKRGEDDCDVSRGTLPPRKGRSIIIRIYESLGGRARGFLRFGKLAVEKIYECNLLEDDGKEAEIENTLGVEGLRIDLKPFEVRTYRLQL